MGESTTGRRMDFTVCVCVICLSSAGILLRSKKLIGCLFLLSTVVRGKFVVLLILRLWFDRWGGHVVMDDMIAFIYLFIYLFIWGYI